MPKKRKPKRREKRKPRKPRHVSTHGREVVGYGYGAHHYSYLLRDDSGGRYLVCLACLNKTYEENDVDMRYCAYCRDSVWPDTSAPWKRNVSDKNAQRYIDNLREIW